MPPFETVTVDTPTAACDGEPGGGHPKVWLNLAASGRVECPYCSRIFVRRGHPAEPPQPAQPKPARRR